jgi:AAA domain
VPDETSYDEPPPYDCIPESADGEPDHEPAKVAIPITEESDSLEEWDAGDDTGLPPPREWLLGNQFCRKFLSGLLAPGATGKSALRLLQLMSLATGRPLSGQHVFKRSRVLLVSLEDDRDELRRRIAAACIHHGVERAELQGWLYCWTPKGIKLAEIKDNARQKGRLETLIRDKVKVRKIDLVALDHLHQTSRRRGERQRGDGLCLRSAHKDRQHRGRRASPHEKGPTNSRRRRRRPRCQLGSRRRQAALHPHQDERGGGQGIRHPSRTARPLHPSRQFEGQYRPAAV